jgi:hypothetical protein
MPNRLAQEQSAYLQSAAHQPVDWYPWGEDAFARARQLNRPILLDIGAVWCHWCHVMDGESYENPATAAIINERFVAIKVDRDERPDVDRRYQEAVSAITGQGGWPLTAFLTPDGDVFTGGTYFPPEDRYGRRGFPDVLRLVADYYAQSRESAESSAKELSAALAAHAARASAGAVTADLTARAEAQMIETFDPAHGGFGGAPKFPHPSAIEFLLGRQFEDPMPQRAEVIRRTLTRMARGGVYDQIGGGFHRYSTDARWIVPHFEKMLYDNTELLRNYAMAYAVFGDPLYRATATGIIRFFNTTLSDQIDGGFYTSQDADVGLHDDGDYFTWTLDEVRAICAPDELPVLTARFDIQEKGEMHHNPARNVLFVAEDIDVIAARLGRSEVKVERLLASGIAKLQATRDRRPTPFVDRRVYAGWNGMAISACLIAADYLDDTETERFALKSLDRIVRECVLADGRVRHAVGAEVPVGLLDDGVFVARALLDAGERGGRADGIAIAGRIMDDLHNRLWDANGGGFFDQPSTEEGVGLLAQPRKPIQDAPTPSANAIAAEALMRLAHMTDQRRYREWAEQTLAAFAGTADGMGIFAGAYLNAAERFRLGELAIVVAGAPDDDRAQRLWKTARGLFSPRKSIRRLAAAPAADEGLLPAPLRAMIQGDAACAYVCAENVCSPPVSDPDELPLVIREFGSRKPQS